MITKINPKDDAEMILIPAGEFQMGDDDQEDNPRHTVYLDDYYIYKNPVTVAQYRLFCDGIGRKMLDAPAWGWKEDHPIVNVTWEDADAYCAWAGARLPTEAEWEKAARGPDGRKFPWGNAFDVSRLHWSKRAYGDADSTTPVGSFPAGVSSHGALDMSGNVWEWCADWYDADYPQSALEKNPTGPVQGDRRVVRGGSWSDIYPVLFRASFRERNVPTLRLTVLGFRCAFDLTPGPSPGRATR